MRRIIELLLIGMGVYLLLMLAPPHMRKGTFRILNGSDLFPESLAFNAGENLEAHGYFFGNSSASATNTLVASNNPVADMYPLYLPSPVTEAVACKEQAEVLVANLSNTTIANFQFTIGTNNSNDAGCPLGPPYFAQAGGHLNPPTGYNNNWIQPGQSVDVDSVRTDSIFTLGAGSCGSIPIQTATFSSGTITLNFAANANNCASGGNWCSPNPANGGSYVQIQGSSVAALNTTPGTVVGTNLYKVTAITNSSISFAGTAGQACGVNCGTAYGPAQVGAPPYTMPLGFDGVRTASPEVYVKNVSAAGGPTINYNFNGDVICVPLTAWNLPTFDGSSGLGAAAAGGRNGVMY